MTHCVVTCDICLHRGQPRKWRHLCEECAVAQQEQHRADTGHHTHLHVITELTSTEATAMFGRAERWWDAVRPRGRR